MRACLCFTATLGAVVVVVVLGAVVVVGLGAVVVVGLGAVVVVVATGVTKLTSALGELTRAGEVPVEGPMSLVALITSVPGVLLFTRSKLMVPALEVVPWNDSPASGPEVTEMLTSMPFGTGLSLTKTVALIEVEAPTTRLWEVGDKEIEAS